MRGHAGQWARPAVCLALQMRFWGCFVGCNPDPEVQSRGEPLLHPGIIRPRPPGTAGGRSAGVIGGPEAEQTMRGELADLEVQRAEAEGQLQQLQEVRATMGPFCPRDAEALRMRRDLPCPHLIPNPGPASREEAWFIRPAPPLRRWRS